MQEDTTLRVYELGFNMLGSLADTEVPTQVAGIKEKLAALGATIISEEAPMYIALSYEMEKVINNKKTLFSHAYFGWIKFEAPVASLETLKPFLDRHDAILRYLLITTVAENTLSPKRSMKGDKRKIDTVTEEGEVAEEVAAPLEEGEVSEEA